MDCAAQCAQVSWVDCLPMDLQKRHPQFAGFMLQGFNGGGERCASALRFWPVEVACPGGSSWSFSPEDLGDLFHRKGRRIRTVHRRKVNVFPGSAMFLRRFQFAPPFILPQLPVWPSIRLLWPPPVRLTGCTGVRAVWVRCRERHRQDLAFVSVNEFVRDLDFGPFSHFDVRRGRWSVVGRDDIVREGASGPYTDVRSLKRGPSEVGNQFVRG